MKKVINKSFPVNEEDRPMLFSNKDVIIFYIEAKVKSYILIAIEIQIFGIADKRRDIMERSIRG